MAFGSVGHYNEVRRINKQKLLEFIRANPDMKIDKVLGVFSLQTGLKITTLKVYIEELRMAELIE